MPGLVSVPRPVRIPPARISQVTLLEHALVQKRHRLKEAEARDLDSVLAATLEAVQKEVAGIDEATEKLRKYLAAIEENEAQVAAAREKLQEKPASVYIREMEQKVDGDLEKNSESMAKAEEYLSKCLAAQKAREDAVADNAKQLETLENALKERKDTRLAHEKSVKEQEDQLLELARQYEKWSEHTKEEQPTWDAAAQKLEAGRRKIAAFKERQEKGLLGEHSPFTTERLREAGRMREVYDQQEKSLSALLFEVYSLRRELWVLSGSPEMMPCQAPAVAPQPSVYDLILPGKE